METIFWTLIAGVTLGYILGVLVGHNHENFTEE